MDWLVFLTVAFGFDIVATKPVTSYDYYRLPTSLRPEKYHLRVLTHLDNPNELTFSGSVKILIDALRNTKNITLHSQNLRIDETQITLKQISGIKKDNCISSTTVNPVHNYYILNTCQELMAGNVYELSVPFAADLNRQMEGYYRSSYKDPVTNLTRWGYSKSRPEETQLCYCFPGGFL